MNLTVLICLLFFAYTSSFSIPKFEQTHLKEIHDQEKINEYDIYEVKHSPEGLKLSYPKPHAPTLREIIYYHVIEKPYEEEIESESVEEEYVVETERPITNGHRFQFLPVPHHKDSSVDKEDEEAVTTEIIEINSGDETPKKDENENKIEPTPTVQTKPKHIQIVNNKNHPTTPIIPTTTPSKPISETTLYGNEKSKKEELKDGSSTSAIEEPKPLEQISLTLGKEKGKKEEIKEESPISALKEPKPLEQKSDATFEIEEGKKEVKDESSTSTIEEPTPSKQVSDITPGKEEMKKEEKATEIITEPPTDERNNVKKNEVIEEKRNARAALFTHAREKYQSRRPGKHHHRSKRHVKAADIPEGPTLSPLNLDSLPEYARKLISTPAPPEMTTGKVILEGPTSFNEEEIQKELQERIEELMASFKPKLVEDSNAESDESDDSAQLAKYPYKHKLLGEEEDDEKRVPRTYGMNLTEGEGYVWNDLLGVPGMLLKIGESDEENEIDKRRDPIDASEEIPSSTHFSTESKPIYMQNSYKEDSDQEKQYSEELYVEAKTNKPTVVIEHSTVRDTDSIGHHSEKPSEAKISKDVHTESAVNDSVTTEGNVKSSTENSITKKINNDDEKTSPKSDNSNELTKNNEGIVPEREIVPKRTTESKTKPADKDSVAEIKEADDKNDGNSISTKSSTTGDPEKHKEETMEEKAKRAIAELTMSEIMQELMKNEEFWKWLGDWTTKYMELIMKHIKNMVHDEVGRQMKKHTANLKKEIQKDIEEALQRKEDKPVETKYKSNDRSSDSKIKEKPVIENKESNKTSENTEAEKELITDGKVLLLTHNSDFENSDKLLKHREDKYGNHHNHKHPSHNSENKISEHNENSDKPVKHREDKHGNHHNHKHPSHNSENKISEHKDVSKNNDNKPSITVTAQNIYGNSAGSDKVTNIFVFYPHDGQTVDDFKPFDNDNQENEFIIDKQKEDSATDLVAQKDESTSTTDVPSTTKNPVDSKNVTVTEKPHAEENKSNDTSKIVSTEPSKDIKDSKNEQDIKEKGSTEANIPTEVTTKANEFTSKAKNKTNTIENKKDKDSDSNKTTTDNKAKTPSEINASNSPTKDQDKSVGTTEHSAKNKNELEKVSSTTEKTKADITEKSTTSPVEKDTGTTEKQVTEHKETSKKTSPASEPKDKESDIKKKNNKNSDVKENHIKASDGKESHIEATTETSKEPKSSPKTKDKETNVKESHIKESNDKESHIEATTEPSKAPKSSPETKDKETNVKESHIEPTTEISKEPKSSPKTKDKETNVKESHIKESNDKESHIEATTEPSKAPKSSQETKDKETNVKESHIGATTEPSKEPKSSPETKNKETNVKDSHIEVTSESPKEP